MSMTVTDQVAACERLYLSRFGREPTNAEVARLTGAYLSEIERARLDLDAGRRREAARRPSKPSRAQGTGNLTYGDCRDCGAPLVRIPGRTGRPPARCDSCRGLS